MSAARSSQQVAVLILGGGVMQLPAVRAARSMGWHVSVAALRIDEEVRGLSHHCLEVDLSDAPAVEAAARALAREGRLDGVFTAGTDFSATVAWVAERLGLPGIPHRAALDATDKARMRARLRAAGVPSPRFAVLEAGAEAGVPGGLSFPLVVKPVDNMGARGVRRIDSAAELAGALAAAWGQSRSGRAIVEELLEGPELSLDALIEGTRVTVCGVADRHIAFAPYFVEMGHTMPSALDGGALRAAEKVFLQGIQALGLVHGAAKGDIKVTPRGPAVGEIAARLSGGYMSGWTFPLSSGVELTAAALRLAVGLPAGDLSPRFSRVSAERAFISIPGRVGEISGLEQAAGLPGVEEVFLRVEVGQAVELPINNMGKCGNVISAAAGRAEAVEAAGQAARSVLIRLEPGAESTDRFLLEGPERGFAAFPEPSRALLRAVSRLADRLPDRLPKRLPSRPEELSGSRAGSEGSLRILVPPELSREKGRDWHGGSLSEALEAVCRATGAQPGDSRGAGGIELGRAFWRCVLKGGAQAGVYLVDTLRAGGGTAGTLWSRLAGSR